MRYSKIQDSRKSVRFEEGNTIYEYELEGNVSEFWLTTSDVNRTRKSASELGSKWSLAGYSILLDNTFENPSKNAEEFVSAFVQLPCGDSDTLRGIERYISDKHDEDRRCMQNRSIKALLICQRIMHQRGWKDSEINEELAIISKRFSGCAADFARRLGRADEVVAHEQDR